MSNVTTTPDQKRAIGGLRGLSGRLLILTIVFVMLAEVLIWAPSISRYRKADLENHMEKAHLAALSMLSAGQVAAGTDIESQLLFLADARGIIFNSEEMRLMMLMGEMPPIPDVTIDLDETPWFQWMTEAFHVLGRDDNRIMRVMGQSPRDPDVQVEILMEEAPLRARMLDFSTRILQLSLVISIFTAVLVYFSLHRLVVRPVRDMTRAMITFREAPEDENRIIPASQRGDEIGLARCELGQMQRDVRDAIVQQKRLAMLGAAVAKINHDLRNSLATAVLAMEKIKTIDDPDVKEATPRLYSAIDRAVSLCSQTLNYVSDEKPELEPQWFHLHEVVAEVQSTLRDDEASCESVELVNDIPFLMDMEADRQLVYRAIANLVLNAGQAGASRIRVHAEESDDTMTIRVSDNGPGLPQKAIDKMFQPFVGSARRGGTGLGLVIVQDAMQAHGGEVTLEDTGPDGTTFALTLPSMRPGSQRPLIDDDDTGQGMEDAS